MHATAGRGGSCASDRQAARRHVPAVTHEFGLSEGDLG
jgi:hypothetical protein